MEREEMYDAGKVLHGFWKESMGSIIIVIIETTSMASGICLEWLRESNARF